MSKRMSEALREAIASVANDAKEKKKNFTETTELQIGLKNNDPQKDERFSYKRMSEALREAIASVANDAKEKKRNFTETTELQTGLKNNDPQSGSVKLPHIPRPKMKDCMLGDAQHAKK